MNISTLIAAARADGRVALDEFNGKQILAESGLAVPNGVVVADETALDSALMDLSPPYAVKVISADIIHKSDAGGVAIGLANDAIDGSEPEPGALALVFRGEERFENMLLGIGVDAHAIVLEAEDHIGPRFDVFG